MFKRIVTGLALGYAASRLIARARRAPDAQPLLLTSEPQPAPRHPAASRRRVHPELTGAAAADRWEGEGGGDLVRSAAF